MVKCEAGLPKGIPIAVGASGFRKISKSALYNMLRNAYYKMYTFSVQLKVIMLHGEI